MEELILVDEHDNEIGVMEKLEAHRTGTLHRAFSILVFGSDGTVLLQRRALDKYHCAGLWTDTCSGHPRPREEIRLAAERRLREEMGITCELTYLYKFFYKVHFDNGMTEHECDYVFVGVSDSTPSVNPEEVSEYRWDDPVRLLKDIKENPQAYAYWSQLCIPETISRMSENKAL